MLQGVPEWLCSAEDVLGFGVGFETGPRLPDGGHNLCPGLGRQIVQGVHESETIAYAVGRPRPPLPHRRDAAFSMRHDGRVTQQAWLVQVVVRATSDELGEITDRISEAICVPAEHDGPCLTPWTLTASPVEDHDEPERSELLALLEEE